jgi:hypothetical protein
MKLDSRRMINLTRSDRLMGCFGSLSENICPKEVVTE